MTPSRPLTAATRCLAGLVLAAGCSLAAAQEPLAQAEPLVPLPSAGSVRPGLGSVLRGWRQGLVQRLHFQAAPEPAAAFLQMTQLRLKLEGDAELAVRVLGGVQLTLRSSF